MRPLAFLLALLLSSSKLTAQQTIERSVVTSGAVRSSTGVIALHGSIGQPIIGISRGVYSLPSTGFGISVCTNQEICTLSGQE